MIDNLKQRLREIKDKPFFELRDAAADAITLAVVILEQQEKRIAELEKRVTG